MIKRIGYFSNSLYFYSKGLKTMKVIRAFSTRVEIEPYEEHENPDLEKSCSTKYDPVRHTRDPIGYRIEGNKFIGPRGLSLTKLSQIYNVIPTMEPGDIFATIPTNYRMLVPPKDDNQKKAISFLLGVNGFERTRKYSQIALNLPPGFGKTYCALYAVFALKARTIVVFHRENIKEQWIDTLESKSNMNMRRVCNINGTKSMEDLLKKDNQNKYDIFFIMHQTITSYLKTHTPDELREWFQKMAFGVKIIDEAHLCFKQTIELDLYSNVPKNIYLTATFTRSDYKEKALYDLVFGNTMRFGQELETAKNVIYQFVPYNSNPSYSFQNFIHTSYGVSATKWSDYAFTMDKYETVYHVFFDVLREAKTHSGKILVVIPKIKYCEIIAQMIRDEYPDEIVATIHSKHTKDENENSKKCASIIVTTTSSMGTGSDIEHIRSLIIMEPYSSEVTAKQLTGRLRPYVQGGDSYAYELVDTGFHSIVSMVNKRITKLKEICKSVKNWR